VKASVKAMGVSIKSAEAERKLRRVSRLLGKSMTATVIELADGKLREIDAKKDRERIHRAVDRIVRRVKALPVLDDRTDDEILGYNKDGLFD
jgi:antitoxin VapB